MTAALATTENAFVRLPALIAEAGELAALRFLEFFTVNIRNPNTRAAYGRAAGDFLRGAKGRGLASSAAFSQCMSRPTSNGSSGKCRRRRSSNTSPAFA
jgi:hypothetical protein